MFWEIITFIFIFGFLLLGWKLRTSYMGEFFIGCLYGLIWEFSAESLFDYTGFTIYLWKDIPLVIILIWGITIGGFALISDYFQKNHKISKNNKKNCLFYDVLTASSIGFFLEYLGSQVFGIWSYPTNIYLRPIILGIPLIWILGWIFIGIFVMAFVRRYQKFFEIKYLEKIIKKYKRK